MKNILLTLFLLIIILFAGAQSAVSVKAYEKGSKALEKKKYHEAIELLTVSIADHPTANAYFNRAVAYYNLGDSCSFCDDLINAGSLHDSQARFLYQSKCMYSHFTNVIPDSILKLNPTIFSLERRYHKCLPDSSLHYFTKRGFEWRLEDDLLLKVLDSDSLNASTMSEKLPKFKGGTASMMVFIKSNIRYPAEALKNKIEGVVIVNAIIMEDGSLRNVRALNSLGYGCDEEAERVVKSMSPWKPGKQRGKPVRVSINFPIKFNLSNSR